MVDLKDEFVSGWVPANEKLIPHFGEKFLEASLHCTWSLSQAEQLHLIGINDNNLLVSNMLCTETSSGLERKH